jgi:hypothetical protein
LDEGKKQRNKTKKKENDKTPNQTNQKQIKPKHIFLVGENCVCPSYTL